MRMASVCNAREVGLFGDDGMEEAKIGAKAETGNEVQGPGAKAAPESSVRYGANGRAGLLANHSPQQWSRAQSALCFPGTLLSLGLCGWIGVQNFPISVYSMRDLPPRAFKQNQFRVLCSYVTYLVLQYSVVFRPAPCHCTPQPGWVNS